MARVNQKGEEIVEETLFQPWSVPATDEERDAAITLLCEHLNVRIVRTNATKHGNTELVLREDNNG